MVKVHLVISYKMKNQTLKNNKGKKKNCFTVFIDLKKHDLVHWFVFQVTKQQCSLQIVFDDFFQTQFVG